MADSDIEDNSPLFVHEEWIGSGWKLPQANDIPLGLLNYFSALKDIPSAAKKQEYPNEHLNIVQFIASKLPRHTFSLPEVQVHQCLSKLKTNEISDKWFKNRTLPPRQLVDKLDKHFRQAVLDGIQSVVDPAYPGSRLPLWGIQFWKDMHLKRQPTRKKAKKKNQIYKYIICLISGPDKNSIFAMIESFPDKNWGKLSG